jgi:6-phosphogluconolactonase/glucosamine-6-phosphate isomerase/deaminase
MSLTPAGNRLLVFPSETYDVEAARVLLDRMRGVVRAKGRVVVALPFGKTPLGIYREWRSRASEFDWSKAVLVNGDEYVRADPQDPKTAIAFFRKNVEPLRSAGLTHLHWIDGRRSPDEGIAEHRDFIAAHGGIDLMVMGLAPGPHWPLYAPLRLLRRLVPCSASWVSQAASRFASVHVWFNEKDSPVDSTLRVTRVNPRTQRRNGVAYKQAITMGLKDVRSTKEAVFLLAKGADKRSAVDLALFGAPTPAIPASVVQHPDVADRVICLVDEAAGT